MARDEAAIKADIGRKKDQKGKLEESNRILDEQIARLRAARDRVSDCKREYKDHQSKTTKIADASYQWKGQRYNKTCRTFDDLKQGDKSAVNDIDAVLDALERDIGQYQNRKTYNLGLIETIGKALNSLWHELKTIGN